MAETPTFTLEIPKAKVKDLDTFTELFTETRQDLPTDPGERIETLELLATQLEYTDEAVGPTTAADRASALATERENQGEAFDAAIDRVAEVAAKVRKVSSFVVSYTQDGSITDIVSRTIIPTVDPGDSRGGTRNIPWGPSSNDSSFRTSRIDPRSRR